MVREALRPAPSTATPVERLAYLAAQPSIQAALAAVREIMGVEIACTTYITDAGQQVIEQVDGDGAALGIVPAASFDFDLTFCKRVLAGELPPLVADVDENPTAASVPILAAIGLAAVASVPLRLSDGSLYGTLCCGSVEPQPGWHERDVQFLEVLARVIAAEIERDLLEVERRRAAAQAVAAEALLTAVEARDSYVSGHCRAVVAHAGATARVLRLSQRECYDVEQVALLHDVGKIAVPDPILGKRGPLERDEWELMREHPVLSERIVAAVPELAHLAPGVRSEHESFDGTGYPDGLAGEQIPIASRIVLVCDAYDAMTSDRPYRRAMSHDVALEELLRGAGTQFDPAVVGAFLAALDCS